MNFTLKRHIKQAIIFPDKAYINKGLFMIQAKEIRKNIFMVENFLTLEECQKYIKLSEKNGFTEATINTNQGHIIMKSIRNHGRFSYDNDALSDTLFRRMKPYLPQTFRTKNIYKLNNRIHFYRYDVGQKFDWHFDGFYSPDAYSKSYFTFFAYLSDDFEGGGTSFNIKSIDKKDEFTIKAKAGTALFFYHKLLHRGDEVTKGIKYAMRSDVMYTM